MMLLGRGNIQIVGSLTSGQILVRKTYDKSGLTSIPSTNTIYKISHSNYRTPFVVIFDEVGETTWTVPEDVEEIEYLVIGGGGSSVYNYYGCPGGGAGGYLEGEIKVVSGNIYTITVGDKGSQSNGYNSSIAGNNITDIIAYGGGKGETNGGSGGGGGPRYSTQPGSGISGQGYRGGYEWHDNWIYHRSSSAGGGGGAGGVGGDGNGSIGGSGGIGKSSNISGENITYCVGGNGTGINQYDCVMGSTPGCGGSGGNEGNGIDGMPGLIIIKYWR